MQKDNIISDEQLFNMSLEDLDELYLRVWLARTSRISGFTDSFHLRNALDRLNDPIFVIKNHRGAGKTFKPVQLKSPNPFPCFGKDPNEVFGGPRGWKL